MTEMFRLLPAAEERLMVDRGAVGCRYHLSIHYMFYYCTVIPFKWTITLCIRVQD